MKRLVLFFLMLFTISIQEMSAKFLQEVELKDGTVLVGYVFRQRPGKFIVFFTERTKKDPLEIYKTQDKNYTLQWKDVKLIRRSFESDPSWCNDKVTLKDGTVYVGQVEEQQLGVQMKLKQNGSGNIMTISYSKIMMVEKTPKEYGSDLWYDRHYTDRLLMTDNTVHEGLIVMRYLGETLNDCYVELLHSSGNRERIYFPDITEYIIYVN